MPGTGWQDDTGLPDPGRRHVIRLVARCESRHQFTLDLQQHKGQTRWVVRSWETSSTVLGGDEAL